MTDDGGVSPDKRATTRDEHLDPSRGPKRILCLDGGGGRSILTLGVLEAVEARLRERHADPDLRLSDYFDLIAGTSTGAVIGAALATGAPVAEVIEWYRPFAPRVFGRRWTPPLTAPRHDDRPLTAALEARFDEVWLGDEDLCTGFLAVTNPFDRRGVWPIANPHGAGCSDFVVREVLRASAAGPHPLQPLRLPVGSASGDRPPAARPFIDGGMSPHNNPAVQAFLATTRAFPGLEWPTGADQLLVMSVGTGGSAAQHRLRGTTPSASAQALLTLLEEGSAHVKTVLEALSSEGPSGEEPQITYVRFNPSLEQAWLQSELGRDVGEAQLEDMQVLDPSDEGIERLLEIGRAYGLAKVEADHFPSAFDLLPGAFAREQR